MAYLSKKKIEDQINFFKKFNHSNSMIFYMINNKKKTIVFWPHNLVFVNYRGQNDIFTV
jgi:hypothetical protein